MSKKIPPHARLPHILKDDPIFRSLKSTAKLVFLMIVWHATWYPRPYNNRGISIDLKIGQFCGSYEDIVNICGKDLDRNNDIKRSVKELIKFNFLTQDTTHEKSIFTITQRETYELILDQYNSHFDSEVTQKRLRIDSQNNNIKKEKKIKKENITYSQRARDLLSFFIESLKKHIPEITKFPSDKDAQFFEKLLENHSFEIIQEVITFSHTDDFWKDKIHTPNNLCRGTTKNPDRFAMLCSRMESNKNLNKNSNERTKNNTSKIEPIATARANELIV